MVDNTTLNPGSGGDTIALDDIGGVKFQRVKLVHGADGVNAGDVSVANGLPVNSVSNSLVSTANSTIANLAAAAVFTGTSEDVSEYSNIAVTVFSSHASATDGLSIQQSADGTNWDLTDVYSIPAASGKIFHIGVAARFYRLVYTNGATLTTSLRIQTLYSKAVKRGSSVRPSDGRGNDNDFEEVAAFLAGYNGASWDRLRSTIANGLAVDVTRAPLTQVQGTRLNNGTAAVAGSFHLTVGGSDGTNLRPVSVDTTGRVNVTLPALTKGTQGATGVSTQDLKDAGRVVFSAATVIAGVTAVTAEALLSMVSTRDGVAAAGATSHAVTANKRLRVQALTVGLISTGASVLSGRFVLRMNPSGVVTATSPIIAIVPIPSGAALAQAGGVASILLPDGLEFSGAMQIGVTQVCNAATGTVWCSIIGYEY